MGEPFLYEFLYRGRPAGDPQDPAWHVVLGQHVAPPGATEAQFVQSGALTPEQAAAAGFPIAAVLDGINAAALTGRDAARTEAARLRHEAEAASAAAVASVEAAQRERDAAATARDMVTAERDELRAQLAALQAAPVSVSDRQFFQALAQAGSITPDEALAAVMTGTLPARIEAAVKSLPAEQQFAARMLLSGATTFERGHPMVAQLGAALDYDDVALDALWRAAAAL
jgi:hypothetical protein